MMTWDDLKSSNYNIKTLINELEGAACDCDMMHGYRCGKHEISNKLREEIVNTINKEIEKAKNSGL